MLNELLKIERGARAARIEMVQRHQDIKDGRSLPTLRVLLGSTGNVSEVLLVPETVTPWTLRDGQHNSFPFMQPKQPLLALDDEHCDSEKVNDKKNGGQRRYALLDLLPIGKINLDSSRTWPGKKLLQRLHERRLQLHSLTGTPAEVVLATIDRFLRACDPAVGGDPARLLKQILEHLIKNLRTEAQDAWVDVAVALLIGKKNPQNARYECAGAFVPDATDYDDSILAPKMDIAVSAALRSVAGSKKEKLVIGTCALVGGEKTSLVSGNFPQPNVAVLGQTYIFAKNKDIPANDRYEPNGERPSPLVRTSLPISQDTAIQLAAAFEALTTDERRGKTWRPIPGEAPKQSDLLLAFVHATRVDPIVSKVVGEVDDDLSEAEPSLDDDGLSKSIRVYENETQSVVDAVQAKDDAHFDAAVDFVVFRKIDPANRKVVYSATTTIHALKDANDRWVAGEQNVPNWLKLPLPAKRGEKSRISLPRHVRPLDLIEFSKCLFIRGGTQKQEIVGIPAAEALALFLETVPTPSCSASRRVRRFLKLVLDRRGGLLAGTVHALRRGFDLRVTSIDLKRCAPLPFWGFS